MGKSRYKESFEQREWTNYTIAVHGLKSALFSIGATKISEMAKQLEFAGKENRIDYIEEHHHEMMAEYENLFYRLKRNKTICPEGMTQEEEAENLPIIETERLDKIISNMEDAMYALDEEILLELIEELEQYQYRGNNMKKVLVPVRRKIEMSDLISAVETVIKWKTETDKKEEKS